MAVTTPDLLRHPGWFGWSAAALIAAGVALGLDIAVHQGAPFAIDTWWNTLLAQDRSAFWMTISLAMNYIGGGLGTAVVGLIIVAGLLLLRRPWGAMFFIIAGVASAAAVQTLKKPIGRPRPPDMVLPSDFGSYPSGHVTNAATVAVVLMVLFPVGWMVVSGVAWLILMAFSRTFLHEHWLTDTIGGSMLGVGVALAAAVAFAPSFRVDERLRRQRNLDPAGLGWTL